MVPQIAEEWEKWRKVSGRKWAVTSNKSDGTKILEHVGNVWKYDSKEDVAHQWISDIVFNESWFSWKFSTKSPSPRSSIVSSQNSSPLSPKKNWRELNLPAGSISRVTYVSSLDFATGAGPKKGRSEQLRIGHWYVEGISSPSLTLNR